MNWPRGRPQYITSSGWIWWGRTYYVQILKSHNLYPETHTKLHQFASQCLALAKIQECSVDFFCSGLLTCPLTPKYPNNDTALCLYHAWYHFPKCYNVLWSLLRFREIWWGRLDTFSVSQLTKGHIEAQKGKQPMKVSCVFQTPD